MRRILLQITALALICTGGMPDQPVTAQTSGYASASIRSIQTQNSAAAYSSDRIQRRNITRAVGSTGVPGVNLRNFGNNLGQLDAKQKPFSGVQLGPSVSPYLALTNPLSQPTDYYTIVKPLQDQRRQNERFAQQQYVQQRKLNQIAAQGPYSVQGDEDSTPTGHPVARMYYSNFNTTGNYFPPPTRPKDDR